MPETFRLIRLERKPSCFREVFSGHRAVAAEKKQFQDLFLLEDDFNRGIFQDYVRFQNDESLKHGAFFMDDVVVSDQWGLVRNPAQGAILNLTLGFGWMPDHFEHLASKGHVAEVGEKEYTISHEDAPKIALNGVSVLLSFPSALTFGHWIVDIWGRVELIKRLGIFHNIDHFLVPAPIAEWMRSLFALFEIDTALIRPLSREKNYCCEHLVVPTVPSQSPGGVIPAAVFGSQFRLRSEFISRWLPRGFDDWSGPLFLQHTPLTSDRKRCLENSKDAEEVIVAFGGRVVNPVKTQLANLLQIIKKSTIVVGQDSSALHNIAFVDKDLIVIETVTRRNMLHTSLQDISNKRIAYLTSGNQQGLWRISQSDLSNVLDEPLRKIRG